MCVPASVCVCACIMTWRSEGNFVKPVSPFTFGFQGLNLLPSVCWVIFAAQIFFNLRCVCVCVWLSGDKCPCVYFRVEVRGQLLRVGSFLHLVASEFEHRLLGLFRYLSWLSLPPYHLFKFNSHWVSRSLVNFLSSYFGNGSHGGFFAFIYIKIITIVCNTCTIQYNTYMICVWGLHNYVAHWSEDNLVEFIILPFCGFWRSTAGVWACLASTLPTEPSFQPPWIFLIG